MTANTTGTLTGEDLYAIFTEMYTRASELDWWDEDTAEFTVTKAVATAWVTWLNKLEDRSTYNCECYDINGVLKKNSFKTTDKLSVMGIPITVHPELDKIIKALNLGRPYRIILTYKDNLIAGTSEVSQFPKFEAWYEKKDNMIYLRGGAALAAAVVTDEYLYYGAESATTVGIDFFSISPEADSTTVSTTSTFVKNVLPAAATQTVTWSVTKPDGTAQAGLTISGGVVTVGGSVPVGNYIVKAVSTADATQSDTATLTITA